MIRGLLVKPNELPEEIEFPEGYKELQKLVDGYIEMPYFFDDVDIVINEEGKFNGSDPNVFVYYERKLFDIIFGNIVIVDHDEEGETISLTDEKIKKYKKIFSSKALFL